MDFDGTPVGVEALIVTVVDTTDPLARPVGLAVRRSVVGAAVPPTNEADNHVAAGGTDAETPEIEVLPPLEMVMSFVTAVVPAAANNVASAAPTTSPRSNTTDTGRLKVVKPVWPRHG